MQRVGPGQGQDAKLLEVRARNGSRSNRIEAALGRLGQIEDATRKQLSDFEDAEIARTLIERSSQTAAYQSARSDRRVTIRTGADLSDFSANLRAPIVIANGCGFQVINEATNAPVRAPLFTGPLAEQAA